MGSFWRLGVRVYDLVFFFGIVVVGVRGGGVLVLSVRFFFLEKFG